MNRDLIIQFLETIREQIIRDQAEKGMRATGKSADSLRINMIDDDEGQLLGSVAIRFQVTGRGPGKFPPRENILEWMRARQIEESALYAIQKKIAERGTDIFQGKRPGLSLNEIIDDNFGQFQTEIRNRKTVETFQRLTA